MTNMERLLTCLADLALAENEQEKAQIRQQLRDAVNDTRSKNKTAEVIIREILVDLGAPDHLLGHAHVIKAVLLCLENEKLMQEVVFRLYPAVAAHFDTVAARVERSIRSLVEVIWTRGDTMAIDRYFGNTIDANRGKPTNSEFIARLVNIVRLHLD